MRLTSVNRRMDEWVTLSRVAVQKGAQKDSPKETVGFPEVSADGPERKLTRNQKRKHDEINHVQKVCVCVRAYVYLQHLPPLPSDSGGDGPNHCSLREGA